MQDFQTTPFIFVEIEIGRGIKRESESDIEKKEGR